MTPSIAGMLQQLAAEAPDRPAIVSESATVTREALFKRVCERTAWLVESGLNPRSMSGVTVVDDLDHLSLTLALLSLHAPSISLSSLNPGSRNQSIASSVGVETCIVDQPGRGVPGARELVLPRVRDDESERAASEFDLRELVRPWEVPDPERLVYLSTSGSTGLPKTFGLKTTFILGSTHQFSSSSPGARVLRTSTIESDATRFFRIAASLAGMCAPVAPTLQGSRLREFCVRAGVTEISVGVLGLRSLLASAISEGAVLPDGTGVVTGGVRVPGPLRKEVLKRLTPNLRVSYAMSETGLISLAEPEDHYFWPEGIGFPVEGVEVSIRDEAGRPVAEGAIGEGWIRKADIWNPDPQVGGWFRTGDLLSWPSEASLHFHGRRGDVTNLNGIKVFPAEIEDVLAGHPAVADVVAYGIPSNLHGEIPAAAVVLADSALINSSDLLGYARGTLGTRSPRIIHIVEEIPRTPSGKPATWLLPGPMRG